MATETFDATDPKFQISDEHKPDKESTWPYPAEKSGWTHSHNAIRGELDQLLEAFEAIDKRGNPLMNWQVEKIKSAVGGHVLHVHGHHTNEDKLMAPALAKRFKYPEKVELDHKELVKKMNMIEKTVENLKEGDKIDDLLGLWKNYLAPMKEHLLEEEKTLLFLFRAYFTHEEGAAITRPIISKAPSVELGSFIHFYNVEKFRSEFMKQEKIPGFVWYLQFSSNHREFVRVFADPVEALKSGVKPQKSGSCFNF